VFGFGGLAQLGERGVRNAEVEGSNPLPSTIICPTEGASPHGTTAAVIVGAALAIGMLLALPAHVALAMVREGGPIEVLTAVLLASAALGAGWYAWRGAGASGWLAAVVLAAAVMRELDFQVRFATVAIDWRWTLGFFGSSRVAWLEKVVVAAVLLALALVVLALLVREGRRFLGALRQGHPIGLALALGLLLMALAQLIDESLASLRRAIPEVGLPGVIVEEVLELGGATLWATTVFQLWTTRRAGLATIGGPRRR
jgi:hypothetical protein